MKITILIALIAVAAMAATANAQTAENNGGVQLRDIPNIGPLFLGKNLLERNKTMGTRLRVDRTPRGQILQVEIVEQNTGEALRQIATVLGVNIVVDPAIQFLPAKTRTLFLNDTKDDVFDYLSDYLVRNEPVEKWKSSAGTYFFAAKPVESSPVTPPNSRSQLSEFIDPSSGLRIFPDGISPSKPQPNWQKREFNGREFYFIPVPAQARPTEPTK